MRRVPAVLKVLYLWSLMLFVVLLSVVVYFSFIDKTFYFWPFLISLYLLVQTGLLYWGSKSYKLSRREVISVVVTFFLLVLFYFYWSNFLVEKRANTRSNKVGVRTNGLSAEG